MEIIRLGVHPLQVFGVDEPHQRHFRLITMSDAQLDEVGILNTLAGLGFDIARLLGRQPTIRNHSLAMAYALLDGRQTRSAALLSLVTKRLAGAHMDL